MSRSIISAVICFPMKARLASSTSQFILQFFCLGTWTCASLVARDLQEAILYVFYHISPHFAIVLVHGAVSKDSLRHMLSFSSYWSGLLLARNGRLSWAKRLHLSLFPNIVIFAVWFLKVCLILGKVEPMDGIKYRLVTAIASTSVSTRAWLVGSVTGCQSFGYSGI